MNCLKAPEFLNKAAIHDGLRKAFDAGKHRLHSGARAFGQPFVEAVGSSFATRLSPSLMRPFINYQLEWKRKSHCDSPTLSPVFCYLHQVSVTPLKLSLLLLGFLKFPLQILIVPYHKLNG